MTIIKYQIKKCAQKIKFLQKNSYKKIPTHSHPFVLGDALRVLQNLNGKIIFYCFMIYFCVACFYFLNFLCECIFIGYKNEKLNGNFYSLFCFLNINFCIKKNFYGVFAVEMEMLRWINWL